MLEEDVIKYRDQIFAYREELNTIKIKYNEIEKIASEAVKLNKIRDSAIQQIKGIVCQVGNPTARGISSKRKNKKTRKRPHPKGRRKNKKEEKNKT